MTSETFLRAWVGRDAIRTATVKAYLLAIARNLARDRARSASRLADGGVPETPVPPNAEARLELARTLAAVRALPVEYREPLLMAAAGVRYDEIGRVLGLSAAVVKIRIHRARLKLGAAAAAPAGRLP